MRLPVLALVLFVAGRARDGRGPDRPLARGQRQRRSRDRAVRRRAVRHDRARPRQQVDGRSHRRDEGPARARPGRAVELPACWATAASRASSTTARAARPTAAPCRSSRPTGSRCTRTWASRCWARPRSGPASTGDGASSCVRRLRPGARVRGHRALAELGAAHACRSCAARSCSSTSGRRPAATASRRCRTCRSGTRRTRRRASSSSACTRPESPYEALPETVDKAVKRWKIRYPVAEDNDYATWKAYGNHYWPAVYLIDARGRIVLRHYGEGDVRRDRDRDPRAAARSEGDAGRELRRGVGSTARAPSPAATSAAPAA